MYYNDEFKRNVVNRYIIGDCVPKIHKDTGVSKSTIYKWINSSKECFSITTMQKTIDLQRQKIKRLENMIKIIQNAEFFKNVSLSERLEIINEAWEEYGINASCDALNVARGVLSIIIKSEVRAKTICTKNAKKSYYLKFKKLTKSFIIFMALTR